MQGSDSTRRYPLTVIVLHWTIAAAMVGLVVLGWWMQAIPKEPVGPRADAYNLHKSIGLATLLLMFARVAWRATHRPPPLPSLPLWQERAATATHALLYAGMFVAAQSLDQKMLEILDLLAKLARGRAQQPERLGVAVEKIRMLPQIGYDLAPADFLRQGFGQGGGAGLGLRLIARAVDHGRLSPPCDGASGDKRAMRPVT